MTNPKFELIGKFLKDAREKAGYTQREIAEELGFSSAQFVSNIERGVAGVPDSLIGKVLRAYRAKPDQFVNVYLRAEKARLNQLVTGRHRRN